MMIYSKETPEAPAPFDSKAALRMQELRCEMEQLNARQEQAAADLTVKLLNLDIITPSGQGPECEVAVFIKHAEAIRDALAPFDTGVRVTDRGDL